MPYISHNKASPTEIPLPNITGIIDNFPSRAYKYNVNPTPFPLILSNKRKTVTFFSFSFVNIWMV